MDFASCCCDSTTTKVWFQTYPAWPSLKKPPLPIGWTDDPCCSFGKTLEDDRRRGPTGPGSGAVETRDSRNCVMIGLNGG